MLETYSSYFPWDYVSWATKAAILSELADRVKCSEVEARAIVDSLVFRHIPSMLGSPDPRTRRSSCSLLGNLMSRKSTASAVLELEPCEQLVSLLSDEKHSDVIREATYTLSQITHRVDGAKGVVDAKALDHIPRLLESPNPETRKWACELMGNLAFHESTAPAILKLNPSMQLVSLLDAEDSLVCWATYTLSEIARWLDGAKGMVDAKVLDHVPRLLKSPNPETQKWACELMGNLAFHESTALAMLKLNPSTQLVSLLGWIARWVDGAKAVVDARAPDHVLLLLKSPNPDTRRWACELTGNLALHESTVPAVLKLKPCVRLVSLLGNESCTEVAVYALSQIAQWPDGAKAVVDAKALDHILTLLQSFDPCTREWACELTGNLALHESTAPTILQLNIPARLVSLLGDQDSVVYRAAYALSQIAQRRDGTKAVFDAKVLDRGLPLLKSPNSFARGWTWVRGATVPAMLWPGPIPQLVSLLQWVIVFHTPLWLICVRDPNAHTRDSTIRALEAITQRSNGSQFVQSLAGSSNGPNGTLTSHLALRLNVRKEGRKDVLLRRSQLGTSRPLTKKAKKTGIGGTYYPGNLKAREIQAS
ncbi:armadillo-type protein [Mycena olivaceomarginata]|nr:armadillo-type protein [Mycena olivaceomarginata]